MSLFIFFINFAITVLACVMFGISCVPFKADWDAVPNSKCFPKKLLVVTNQVNSSKICSDLSSIYWTMLSILRLGVYLRHCHSFNSSVSPLEC